MRLRVVVDFDELIPIRHAFLQKYSLFLLKILKRGHPLKGKSREKTPLHGKKYSFFLGSKLLTSTALRLRALTNNGVFALSGMIVMLLMLELSIIIEVLT